MNNKGLTLNALYPAVLAIITIAIALGIGIFILNETAEAISTDSISVINETLTTVADAGEVVATFDDCAARSFAMGLVTNASGGEAITSANYTFTAATGTLAFTGTVDDPYNNTDWNVSYTYTGTNDAASTSSCGVLETSGTGLGGMASWIAVIVVVIAAAVVLGIVISSFGKNTAV